jgi:hypothetical protein
MEKFQWNFSVGRTVIYFFFREIDRIFRIFAYYILQKQQFCGLSEPHMGPMNRQRRCSGVVVCASSIKNMDIDIYSLFINTKNTWRKIIYRTYWEGIWFSFWLVYWRPVVSEYRYTGKHGPRCPGLVRSVRWIVPVSVHPRWFWSGCRQGTDLLSMSSGSRTKCRRTAMIESTVY